MQSHYQNNAYRILGLPGNASRRTVLESATRLRLRARLAMPFPGSDPLIRFFPLPLSESLLDDALRRLQTPSLRILERLFWFTSADSVDADCFKNLEAGDLNWAKAHWSQSTIISRRANAARTSHLFALTAEPSDCERKYWAVSIDAWKRLMSLDEFWKLQRKLENDSEFFPLASDVEFAKLEEESQMILLRNHTSAVKKALEKDEFVIAAGHLSILRNSEYPSEMLIKLENGAIERFASRLEQIVQKADSESLLEGLRLYQQSIKPGWKAVFAENSIGTAAALHLGETLSKFLLQLAERFLGDRKPDLSAECLQDAIAITAGTALARRQRLEVERLQLAIEAERQRVPARSTTKSINPPEPSSPIAIQSVTGVHFQKAVVDEEQRLLKESRYGLIDNLVRVRLFPYDMPCKVFLLVILVFSQLTPPWEPTTILPSRPEARVQPEVIPAPPAGYVINGDAEWSRDDIDEDSEEAVAEEEEEEEEEYARINNDEDIDNESQGESDE